MDYPLKIPTTYDLWRGRLLRAVKGPYVAIALLAYSFIAALVVMYLAKPKSYVSEMELVLPGTGASSSVSLDEVGQVVTQTSTPFSGGFNPRVNYKEILSSRGLLESAAKRVEMSPKAYGKAQIRLTEQTSILAIEIDGVSPEQAHKKAWALYDAFQQELDHLRADEVRRRDDSIKAVLAQYQKRLGSARINIVDFQQRALLVSEQQVEQLVATLAKVNEQRLQAKSDLAQASHYITQLSTNIGVSPRVAGKALMLQSDPEFRGYLQELDSSAAQLTEYRSYWGEKHPKVISQSQRLNGAKQALLLRSQQVTGVMSNELSTVLNLDNNPKRAALFADLIAAFAQREGQRASLQEMERNALHLEDRLKLFTRESAELDRLQKEFDLAEAVYTSAAARLEANKADIFASYPVVQMLTMPSIPQLPSSPLPLLAIVAAVAGCLFVTFGLLVVWHRQFIISLVLKNA